jgi:hypothetical protein
MDDTGKIEDGKIPEQSPEKGGKTLRHRKTQSYLPNFFNNEKEIFGDELEDDLKVYATKKKKIPKRKSKAQIVEENQKLTDMLNIPQEGEGEPRIELVEEDEDYKEDEDKSKKVTKTRKSKSKGDKKIGSGEVKIEVETENNIKRKKGKTKVKVEESGNEEVNNKEVINYGQIVDINELKIKPSLSNSDYILLIMEICLNPLKYGLKYSNSTRLFWDEVANNTDLYDLLKQFKPETLRKYWRIIRDLENYNAVLDTVKENATQIDDPNLK